MPPVFTNKSESKFCCPGPCLARSCHTFASWLRACWHFEALPSSCYRLHTIHSRTVASAALWQQQRQPQGGCVFVAGAVHVGVACLLFAWPQCFFGLRESLPLLRACRVDEAACACMCAAVSCCLNSWQHHDVFSLGSVAVSAHAQGCSVLHVALVRLSGKSGSLLCTYAQLCTLCFLNSPCIRTKTILKGPACVVNAALARDAPPGWQPML